MPYWLNCRANTESKKSEVVRTKNETIMLLSKCTVCDRKKWKFIKEQEAKGLLGNLLGAKILIFGDIPSVNTLLGPRL